MLIFFTKITLVHILVVQHFFFFLFFLSYAVVPVSRTFSINSFILFFTVSTLRMAPRPAEAPWTGPRPRQVSSYRTFPRGGKVSSTGAIQISRCRPKACLETLPSPPKGKSCVELLAYTCACVCVGVCVYVRVRVSWSQLWWLGFLWWR